MPKKTKIQSSAPAEDAADQPDNTAGAEATTMGAFERRDDRDRYLSIRQAAQHIYGDKYEPKHDQTVRNAAKKRAEFQAPGALINVTVEGYDIPPLTYLRIDAIDAYHAANEAGGGTRGGRGTRGGKRRQIVRLTAEEFAAYNAGELVLTVEHFPLEVASTPKPGKAAKAQAASATPTGAVSSDMQPDMFDPDMFDPDMFDRAPQEPIEV